MSDGLKACDLSHMASGFMGKYPNCSIICAHVCVNDSNLRANKMINEISNVCWIKGLNPVAEITYTARSSKTIEKLLTMLRSVGSSVGVSFGEYLVSDSARAVLRDTYSHRPFPIAELWKEKLSNNPGFDFHTETPTDLLGFGEAKYSGVQNNNPYRKALVQIRDFILAKKGDMELIDLQELAFNKKIVEDAAIHQKRSYIAAFSINSTDYTSIFTEALEIADSLGLMNHPELYLIGIEVGA